MHPCHAALLEEAELLADKLAGKEAATPVLWQYEDIDSGEKFFLPRRMQNVHSPYSGKSTPQRPVKFQIPAVQKELADEQRAKGVPGAPGPKAGTPRKKKHAADPAWKADA